MDLDRLNDGLSTFKSQLLAAITTATYNGKIFPNGQKAKEALIRSQSLIFLIHETTKTCLFEKLKQSTEFEWEVHPPVGASGPELKVYGRLKGKNQDLVFIREPMVPYIITDGPNIEETDRIGMAATASAIVIGVRSQMSSVDKNFDTLMERAFAETLNLRLRLPGLIMAEVYLLPLHELNDKAMLLNEVLFSKRAVNLRKFIRAFSEFTGRGAANSENLYKYDATALLLVDFSTDPPNLIRNEGELAERGLDADTCEKFSKIKPEGFDVRLIEAYKARHSEV